MENLDFDRIIEKSFGERRITPSEDAWERVMLQRQSKKSKKTFPLFWIAAMFIAALGIFVFSNGSDEKTTKAVAAPAQKIKPIPEPMIIPAKGSKPEIIKDLPVSVAKNLAIALPKKQVKPVAEAIHSPQAEREQRKIEEITAVVIKMNESGNEISEDDVDALIEKARREIAAGNGPSKQTNASALLNDSEKELTEEFRSNVFQNIIKHKRIKIAFGGSR